MKPVPTLNRIFQRREGERRSIGRTTINRTALLFFRGQSGVFSCCVSDVTNHGAGIRGGLANHYARTKALFETYGTSCYAPPRQAIVAFNRSHASSDKNR
jgi:hypothetical protein